MEIPGWTGDGQPVVRDAAESVGQRGGTRVEPVVVRLRPWGEKQPQPRKGRVGVPTMQTASTPSNQDSLPFLTSAMMNSSRPSEPVSSIPSKQRRRFTGRGLLRV